MPPLSACSIPPLEEIVAPETALANCGPYSRANFVAYLAAAHCTENLEFVVEIDRFYAAMARAGEESLAHQWRVLHKVFIAKDLIKEVNIPWTLRCLLLPETLPLPAEVVQTRSVVYELLLDSYNEFILHTRESTNDSTTLRRRLEAVPPDQPWLPHADVGPCVPCTVGETEYHRPSAAGLKDQWEKALLDFEVGKSDVNEVTHAEQPSLNSSNCGLLRSRNGSDGTVSLSRTSRCSSIGSVVEGIKGYLGFKKAVRRLRRGSDEPGEKC